MGALQMAPVFSSGGPYETDPAVRVCLQVAAGAQDGLQTWGAALQHRAVLALRLRGGGAGGWKGAAAGGQGGWTRRTSQ